VRANRSILLGIKKPFSLLAKKTADQSRFYVALVVFLLTLATIVRIVDPFLISALRQLTFDWYQRLDPVSYDPEVPVRIVDIDEASLAKIGQWPWPRSVVSDLLAKLADKGAAVVGFDVLFVEPDRSSIEEVAKRLPAAQASSLLKMTAGEKSNDQIFADVLEASPSVLGMRLTNEGSSPPQPKAGFAIAGDDPRPFVPAFSGASANLGVLDAAAHGIGSVNWLPDRDQIVRRVPLLYRVGDKYVPSFAAEVLRVAQGASTYVVKAANASGETAFGRNTGINHIKIGNVEVPTNADGRINIMFRHINPAAYIPAWKVLSGEVSSDDIAGRIILIGTSAPGLLDLRATPLDSAAPGIDIHAQVLEHILTGRSLVRPDYALGLELSVIIMLGLLLALMLPRVTPSWAAIATLLIMGALVCAGWLAFHFWGLLIDTTYPALASGGIAASITTYLYRGVERQRRQIRSAFRHYLSPALVEQLAQSPEKLVLGGEEREMTIMFSDVRGFTTISETYKHDPQGLTRLMNRLLTPLTNAILVRKGTIDKYMGDAIMAFWNAPLDDEEHEVHACEAAVDMLGEIDGLNKQRELEAREGGHPYIPLKVGIGLNTGGCVVGNMGSDLRFDYSVLGDSVNLASRLEGQTKDYGFPIIAGSKTAMAVKDKFAVLELDFIMVKGKKEPEAIYAISGRMDTIHSEGFQRLRDLTVEMLACYRSRDWENALAAIDRGRKTDGARALEQLYNLYETRIQGYQKDPPPENWNGAFALLTK